MVPPIMALVVDVEKAHQQVPVAEEDWRHVACSADPMPEVYRSKRVGTFFLKP
jgi:hypothetical protein